MPLTLPTRGAPALVLIVITLLLAGVTPGRAAAPAGGAAASDTDLFAPVTAQVAAAEAALATLPPDSPARVERLLDLGRMDEALPLLDGLRGDARAITRARARAYLAVQDFTRARPLINAISQQGVLTDAERGLRYSWLFAIDDAAQVDRLARRALQSGRGPYPDLLAAGRLAADLFDFDRADSCFSDVVRRTVGKPDTLARAAALRGLGVVAYKRRDFDRSFENLRLSLALSASAENLEALAETLVRLSRTNEAITASEWAIRLNPYFDPAHYYLGNGYTRRNYSELYAAYPKAFADADGREALREADSLLALGRRGDARYRYLEVKNAHPGWADVLVRLASLDWEDGQFEAARDGCFAALKLCPGYGRAHATLAKALESQRFLVDVHRADYERRFEAQALPEVPGIEKFVVNWKSLNARHQKRVALSIAPWKAFIPVLLEAGSTFYIKPLYALLSEAPGQESLRDQRINYDSRLWDDVRGCGGFRTVTGLEDVERTIFDRYNTVLHELTHQVHGVLTADQGRVIQEHYNRAKKRDEQTRNGFLSRYAGGSVFEYFAEGANALLSPRRDVYDTRDIVRERLTAIDPDLRKLVADFFAQADVSASYAVAAVNAGNDHLERGDADGAIVAFRRALERAPTEETALQALAYALSLKGEASAALAASEKALAAHGTSGGVITTHAEVLRHSARGLDAALAFLAGARGRVRAEDRYLVDLALAGQRWAAGDADGSLAAVDSVLAYQSDNPEGLWSRAAALALAGRFSEAWKAYDQAVRLRTGVVELRDDYARDLLRGGRTAEARQQLDEAKTLDPEDPVAEALRGWADLARGDRAGARAHLAQALQWAPWCDLATILLGRVQQLEGDAAAAGQTWAPILARLSTGEPPEYIYRAKQSTWRSVHDLPAVERDLLTSFQKP